MADISLLFEVAGGGSLSGESGKRINDQLTAIINEINRDPFKIKILADEKSLNDLVKRVEEIKKSIGDGGLIKIDSAELSGITKTLNQISDSLIRIMGAIGKNSVSIGKFEGQLQDIFEAIPAESNVSAKAIDKITDSFSDLIDKIGDLGATVEQINNKRFGTTINLTGSVQESMEQVTAYREYLTALLKDFNDLSLSYQHLMQNSSNPRFSGMAYAAGNAVNSNKRLLDTIRGFNFNDMIAQTGIMDFDQLKQTIALYESLIASMTNIQYKGSAIFSAGDRTAIDAARTKIQDIEHSLDNIGEAPEQGGGNNIFEYVDKVREAIETLNAPLDVIKEKINEALDLGDIPEDKRNVLTNSVQELSNSISNVFSDLRNKITEALDLSKLPEDGDKALVERMKNECTQIEDLFTALRAKIESVFDFSDVDTSSITSIVENVQEALNGLTIDLGKVNVIGNISTQPDLKDNLNLIRETKQLRDLIPEGVKIDTSVSEKTLTQISSAMQRLSIAENDAGTLSNLFKNLSGTITEVTTKIVNQGEATERLKNVTIKGIDEEGQAFTRSADYFVKHSKKRGDYYDSQTTTIRKQIIAQQEQIKKTKEQTDADEAAAEAKEKVVDTSIRLTRKQNDLWNERNKAHATDEDWEEAWRQADEALEEEEQLIRQSVDAFYDREDAAEAAASAAEQRASEEANSLERRNKLIKESLTLEAQLVSLSYNGKTPDSLKGQIDNNINGLRAWRQAVSEGAATNDAFASIIGRTKTSIKEYNTEIAAAVPKAKILGTDTKEYADAMNRLEGVMGTAQNALNNYTAAENSKSESSRNAYKSIKDNVDILKNLEDELETGTMEEDRFRSILSNVEGDIKKNTNTIKENGDAHKSLSEGITKTIRNFSQWLGVSRILMGAIRTIKQMVSAVIELDTAMTELRKVTDETEARYSKFLEDAGTRAKQVGASLKDTVNATADFARLGYSVDQAEKLADAAIIYKNVGDGISDITEASESIIATMQAFAIKPEDVMSIVDKFNDVGNKFAISSGGVGEALLRSAAAMQAANNTLDETIALATAANKIVQNPQIVGTSLKTISMYLRAAKTEAEEAGEETDGMAESVSKLRDEILSLTGNRVDIQIDENTFKSTYQILKDLSEVWGDLSDVSQANIQALVGGKRNANVVAALLTNFSEAEKALQVSIDSINSATKENEKVLASIQGRINKFKASFEVLSSNLINGEFVKSIIDAGTGLLNIAAAAAKLFNAIGGLKTVLIGVSPILINLISSSGILSTVLSGLKTLLLGMVSPITNAISAWKAYASGIITLGSAMQASLGVISIALTAIVAVYSRVKQAERERRDAAIEAGKAADTESKEIKELYDKYTDLNEKIKEDDSLKGDLEDTTESLLKKLGIEKDKVDELADSYGGLSEAIANATMDQLKENQIDLVEAYQAAVKDLQDAVLNPNKVSIAKGLIGDTDLNAIKKLVAEGLIDRFEESDSNNSMVGGYSQYSLIGSDNLKTPEGIYDAYERLTQIVIKLEGTSGVSQRLVDVVSRERDRIKDQAIAYKEAADALNDNLIQQGIIDSRNIEDLADIRNHIINVVGANRVYAGSIEDVIETVDELLKKDERFAEFYGLLEEGADNAASGQSKAIQRVETDFDRFKDEISKLGSALDEFQENKEISTETYQKLAGGEDKDKYADLFKISDAGIELQTDKLNAYVESLEQEYGAKMALNGATEDEIRMMMALGSTLITLSEDTGNVASEIVELRGYIDDLNKGSELSWDEADALSKKYPKLATAIYRAEKGYRVEIEAIEDLIAVKSEYLKLTDREAYVIQARNALNLHNNGNTTAASKIDEIFSKYQEIYGKAITSLEEFKTGYTLVFDGAFEGAYEAYEDYIDALIESNKKIVISAERARDALEGTGEGIDVDKIEDATKSLNDLKSELDDLTDIMKKLNEGTELSTSETITLLMKYPTLRDHIIKTANGYKIETQAIKDLIAAKVQLITTTDKERRLTSAKDALYEATKKDANAEKADIVFADYLSKNGRNIETIEEYKEAYKAYWGYAAKVSKEYAQAKIDALKSGEEEVLDPVLEDLFSDYLDDNYKEGYTPEKESGSSEKDVETEFERMYKLHQHYLAMDQETVEQYLNWLDGAYKASYAAGEMELDDYYQYEEEVYEKRKELFQTNLDVLQHQIDLLSHKTTDTSAEQIAIYEQMQREVNAQANRYRAKGIKDNDELIRELQNQWWQYEENIRQLRESAFNDWVSDRKFVIEQLKLDKADADVVIGAWKEILGRINAEIEYYSNKGYDITTDVIQSLLGELQSAKEAMISALDEVVQKANEVVDGFENVYKTLTDAAREYASTGYLSVDSLQSILSLGPKYLDMLTDESGQLIINEDRLQKVIAARTEEMAAETALSYAKQILLATEQDDADALRDLTQATAASSGATWDLAYATLGYAKALAQSKGMSTDFYDDAISYVTKMQSVTKTAVDSVSSYYLTLKDGYVSQAEGLETILKLTEDMIKQENSDRVDALEKEKELYKDIIDEKKEILRLTKEQEDHDRDTADKLKEIADLQSRIDQLALDDSREAQAQRTKLEAELYEKQKALADDQADYAYEAQTEALDKQYEEFEKEKDDEIDALKDMLGSAEQLYQAAIARIDSGWDTLYQDLLDWNYKYGSTLQKDLTAAWDAAKAAAERYGSFVNAMEGVKDNTNLGAASMNPSSEAVQAAVNAGSSKFTGARDIIDRMRANSIAWFTGDHDYYSGENNRLAEDYRAATGKKLNYKNGLWYEEGSSTPIYDLSKDQAARNQIGAAVVATMKANSEMWKTADPSQRPDIEKRNERLAAELANFLGIPITKTKSGVWMLGDTPLYSVTKFHSGGIAGGGTARQNEVMALLKKGEAILDDKREEALYKTVDFVQVLSDKIGRVIDAGRISSLLNGTAPLMRNYGTPALAGGIGTMNFSPTVNVTIAGAGDLSESTARKYGNIAADSVLEQLKNAFSQRGVSSVGNGILK